MKTNSHPPLDLESLEASWAVLDTLPFPVLYIDADYGVRFRNVEAERIYGASAGTCHELTHGFGRPCDEHGESCPMGEATRTQTPVSVRHVHVTGELSASLFQVVAVPLTGGGILECHIGLDQVIAEDELTGLWGRGFFTRIVERELTLLERLRIPYAFVVVDLDGLKTINDDHGHEVGDAVLRRIAAVLQQDSRRSDAAGRWGGDEFALFLPSLDRAGALAWAERKLESIQCLVVPSSPAPVRPRASFGLFWSDQVYDLKSAFHAADRALYDAKHAGGDRVSRDDS